MKVNEPGVERDYKGNMVFQSLGDGMPKKKEPLVLGVCPM
jgi:hypothetical protein